ncbi:unnamed protein product [Parnassius mnemosyne]|uniref:Reverse transcriptase domain-containing protein n=1 Tax=Parnassius mnemosyne TaxID=213953 RepID=A0AAV1L9Q3_9NEOP
MITEKLLAANQRIFCAFVDLEEAFDKVVWKKMWELLPGYGVDGRLLRAVQSLYCDCKACVRVGHDLSPMFSVQTGVKQGCLLNYKRYGININGQYITHFQFADDIVLIADSQEDLSIMLNDLNSDSQQIGFKMNVEKT